ncbi:hypothetical protein HPP92_018120 [Vanilla planifolia]|nr:hypothetical protein HPP92_018120 [Vanilla planifolia]
MKVEVSAHTYVKMRFSVEKQLSEGEVNFDLSQFPSWKTKPEKVAAHFEVLARLEEGGRWYRKDTGGASLSGG